MKKFIIVLLLGSSLGSFAQTELIHDAKVTGNLRLGSKEVTAIQDLETDCIYKTEPHNQGDFVLHENVKLSFSVGTEHGEVVKPTLPEVVSAHKHRCPDEPVLPTDGGPKYECVKISKIERATGEERYNDVLRSLGVGMIDLVSNSDVRNLIKTECEKQFDGDDNVLFRDLEASFEQNLNKDLLLEIKKAHNKYTQLLPNKVGILERNWPHFEYMGNNLYPQIFIPFIDQVDHNLEPIIAFNYYDEDVLDGIKLVTTTNGDKVVEEIQITESIAKQRPVWVISVNERVDNSGVPGGTASNLCPPGFEPFPNNPLNMPPPSCSDGIQNGDETGVDCGGNCVPCHCTNGAMDGDETGIDCGGSCGACAGYEIRFYNIAVSDKKEGWGNGRADISYAGLQVHNDFDCNEKIVLGASGVGWFLSGDVFLHISNNELTDPNDWNDNTKIKWKSPYHGKTYIAGYAQNPWTPASGEVMGVVLYEEDRRGTDHQYIPYDDCPDQYVWYNSRETAYGMIFFDNPADWPATS